jgi:hypothetical protein
LHPDLACGAIRKKDQPEKPTTLSDVFHHRMREFYYKPALSSAFLLDPVKFVRGVSAFELPFEKMTGSEQYDALKDIERLGGADAVAELSAAQLNGFVGVTDLQKNDT